MASLSNFYGVFLDIGRSIMARPSGSFDYVSLLRDSKYMSNFNDKINSGPEFVDHGAIMNYTGGAFTLPRMEKDPHGKNLKEGGAKADAGKSPIFQGCIGYFPRALQEVADVSFIGANKYSWKGWETVPDGVNRYTDALCRHLVAENTDGDFDSDTRKLHAAHIAWNALARLELILRQQPKKDKNAVY